MAYVTHRNLLLTAETAARAVDVINSIPFDGDGRLRIKYKRSIARFFEHIFNCALVWKKHNKRAAFKGDDKYTQSIPIPHKVGYKFFDFVFKPLVSATRALEILEERGLIKIVRHNHHAHKCREIAVSREFLNELYGDRNEYLKREDRLVYLQDCFSKHLRTSFDVITLDILFAQAFEEGAKESHVFGVREIRKDELRQDINMVRDNMAPVAINLTELVANARTPEQKALVIQFAQNLAVRGATKICDKPLICVYFPDYNLADVGSRLFESGTGFQTMPNVFKWKALAYGYNYDIKSCQTAILAHELNANGLDGSVVKLLDNNHLRDILGDKGSDEDLKKVKFSILFNMGSISSSPKGSLMKTLQSFGGDPKYNIGTLKHHLKPLSDELKKLVEVYTSTATVNKFGRTVTNAVGQPFGLDYDVRSKTKITGHGRSKRSRQLLAHMIQGIEADAVHTYVREGNATIVALEHDGFVSMQPVRDWNHPYLKLVLKHESIPAKKKIRRKIELFYEM